MLSSTRNRQLRTKLLTNETDMKPAQENCIALSNSKQPLIVNAPNDLLHGTYAIPER